MSHFYAKITESARKTIPTARGHASIETVTQSWNGQIRVRLWVCPRTKEDRYSVVLQPHGRTDGSGELIIEGTLSRKTA